jgi:hypothetical protein
MKLSELITRLRDFHTQYGDIPVVLDDDTHCGRQPGTRIEFKCCTMEMRLEAPFGM